MPLYFIINFNGLEGYGDFLPLLAWIWLFAGCFCRFLDSGSQLRLFGVAFEYDFTTMQTVYQEVTAIGFAFVQKHLG